MSNGAGHLMYGAVRLSEEEVRMLREREKKLNKQFPGCGVNMKNFLDTALRIGVDIELQAIRKEMEADKHVEHE